MAAPRAVPASVKAKSGGLVIFKVIGTLVMLGGTIAACGFDQFGWGMAAGFIGLVLFVIGRFGD